jgi:hypothetical protein
MPLSFAQYQGLFWTAIIASVASMAGSALIVWNSRKRQLQRKKGGTSMSPQQRLVLSLSINDFVASLNTATLALMVPAGTPSHYWAVGSTTTCTISGFLTILFFLTTTCYNCSLSIYYLLTVRYNIPSYDKVLRTKLEIPTHVLTWTLSFTFAILGVIFKGYNPKIIVNICFLDSCSIQDMVDAPGGCPDGPTDMLAGAYIIAVGLFAAISLVSTALVYQTVRQKINGTHNNSNNNGAAPIRYQNLPEDLAKERLRLVSSQAVAYTLIYLNLLLWQTVLVVLSFGEEWAYYEGEGQGWFYFLQWMSWLFIPGQGFMNCLVYTRPKYLRWRHVFPEARIPWLYWKAFQMEDPPTRASILDSRVTVGPIIAPSSEEELPPDEVEYVDNEKNLKGDDDGDDAYKQKSFGNRIVGMSSISETNVLHSNREDSTRSKEETPPMLANTTVGPSTRSRLTAGQQALIASTLQRFNEDSTATAGSGGPRTGSRGVLLTNHADGGSSRYLGGDDDSETDPEWNFDDAMEQAFASSTPSRDNSGKRSLVTRVGMDGTIQELSGSDE